jgi:Tol biopolymer transport system component
MMTFLRHGAGGALTLLVSILAFTTPAFAQYFGQNKVQYDRFDFEVLETEHFDIYYYPIEAEAAKLAGQMAERWYTRLSTLLSHELSTRQPVIFYASHPEFEQTNVIEGLISETTGGVTEGGRRRVVMPFAATLAETDHVLGHELVHAFQYDILGTSIGRAPLWFIEGMAEYLSVGPRHPHTAMWLRDAALEGKLPDLKDLYNPTYFPYRFGHAVWAFIGGRFGDAAVASALHRVGSVQGGMDAIRAIELTTNMAQEELSAAWHASIHELYGITPRDRQQAQAAARELPPALLADRSGSGSLNIGPSLSPNGERIAFLSERSRLSVDHYVADTETGGRVRRLTTTAVDPHFESLQFLSSSGTWAPDNRRLAVASVQRGRGALTIFDADNGDRLQDIRLEDRGEIFQPSWSPDGRFIAFSAQMGGFTDLFVHDLETAQMRRLTTDPFADLQPTWSPDGRRLLFVTDRHTSTLETLTFGQMGLAIIDVADGQITAVPTGLRGMASSPQWSPDGSAIAFISDHSGRPDVYRVASTGGEATPLTALPTGVSGITPLSPALSVARDSGATVYTVFRNGAYEIRVLDNDAPKEVTSSDLGRLPPGERPSSQVAEVLDKPAAVPAAQTFDTRPYSSNLSLIGIGQSLGASTGGTFGTYVSGGISMLFSDVLGNHLLPVTVGVDGGAKDIGAQTAYINRTKRWNWGVVAGHVPLRSGFVEAGFDIVDGFPVYVERTELLRETSSEIGALLAYPFSRTTRVEFDATAQRIGFGRERDTRYFDVNTGQFLFRDTEDLGGFPALRLFSTTAALIRDQAAFGAVGPILGQRFRFEVSPTFGDLQMTTASLDFRQYVMPVRPLTLAMRGIHVGRYGAGGEDSRLFPLFLGYPSLVRGYAAGSFDASECTVTADGSCPEFDRLRGSRLLVFNGEARIPLVGLFTRNLDYGPIPVELFGFFDAGVAWDRNERPTFADGTRSWVSSTGLGARVNLFGYAVGEFNMARALDRPGQGWQFVFNLRPGF